MRYTIFIILSFLIFIVACGNGHDKKGNAEVVKKYIESKGTKKEPTYLDYKSANIEGVTKNNVKQINKEFKDILSKKVDFNTIGIYYSKHYPCYRYNVKQNYIYDFNNTSAAIKKAEIKNSVLSIPKLTLPKSKSIFLKIDIQSDLIGQYFPPTLTLQDGNKTFIHTFERGAAGIRYLNISELNIAKNRKIALKGKHLNIPNQKAEIILYKNENLKNKKILILATHPDDAEIAAYGLYSKYNKNSYIVTITAGDAGYDTIYHNLFSNQKDRYLEKGKRRTWDSLNIPKLGGVHYEHILNLGFFDGTLYTMYRYKNKNIHSLYIGTDDVDTFRKQNESSLSKLLSKGSNWNSFVDNLAILLEKIKPDIIVTPYPRIDRHSDHRYTTVALFEALKKLNIRNGKLFLYTNHPFYTECFPFGKRGQSIDLPPVFGKALYFNGIYSLPLDKKLQSQKLLALEEMSDLRFEANGNPFDDLCKNKDPLTCRDFSYFRRAVRNNELFFIVDIKNIYNKKIFESILH